MSQEDRSVDPAHVPVLDGIRGLAILLVLLTHLTYLPQWTWLDRWVVLLGSLGWFGVDLFFVLSGFLITGILLDARGAPHYFRNFYLRRVLRIFPLYYLVLFVSLFVLPGLLPPDKAARFGSIAGDELYYWLYLSNYAIARAGEARHGVLDVTWSLAIEEQFYVVWPAVVFLCRPRSLVKVAAALFAGSLLLRTGLHAATNLNGFSIYVLTPCRLDGLATGAFLAVAAREPGGLSALRRPAGWVLWASLPFALGIPLLEERFEPPAPFGPGFGPIFNIVGFTLLALLFGALLVRVVTAGPETRVHRLFASGFFRTFGKYSYGLYLIHLPLRAVIRDRLFGPSIRAARYHFPSLFGSELPGQLMFYVLAGGAALGAAWVSYQVFEKQFLKLKRFFPSGAARTQAPALSEAASAGPGAAPP